MGGANERSPFATWKAQQGPGQPHDCTGRNTRTFESARINYANNTINALESLEQAMNKFDIPKGSVYDQAVSWVLQGSKEVDGKPVAYGLEQLKAEFPKDWEDISKAAEYGRGLLDQYYQRMVVMNENLGIPSRNISLDSCPEHPSAPKVVPAS